VRRPQPSPWTTAASGPLSAPVMDLLKPGPLVNVR
jgi:hypothetical protein